MSPSWELRAFSSRPPQPLNRGGDFLLPERNAAGPLDSKNLRQQEERTKRTLD